MRWCAAAAYRRGVGASGGSTPASVEEMADDAIAFIRALGLDQVDLLGFSLGGFIAQVVAQRRPDLVRKMSEAWPAAILVIDSCFN
jgi:pimeloyl-ACP methyl ester carboxylesterase